MIFLGIALSIFGICLVIIAVGFLTLLWIEAKWVQELKKQAEKRSLKKVSNKKG